jgi:hypothetical protein
MKKTILTYFFFAMYILAMVKPMLPVLDYYINYDYIASQLCENRNKPILDCNGKCYVAKEIENNKTENNSELIVPEFKLDLYITNTINLNIDKNSFDFEFIKRKPIFINLPVSDNFLFSIFHPPQINA